MKFGNVGIEDPFKRTRKSKPKKQRKKRPKKSKGKTSRKRQTYNKNSGMDIGIPDMNDLQVRSGTQKERRKARKNGPKGSRVIGMTSQNEPIFDMGNGRSVIGDPLEGAGMLNTDISKIKYDNEFDYNLGDTGFGLKQKDLNKDKHLDKKPLNQITFKTPFGDVVREQTPITGEDGNLERNDKGIVKTVDTTRVENVNPAIEFIGKGLQIAGKTIKQKLDEDKKNRQNEELIKKAVEAQKPNDPNTEYCVLLEDRDSGQERRICYSSKTRAENAIQKARAEGLRAVKV